MSLAGSSLDTASRIYEKKQSTEPIQSSKENPPNSSLQNFIHSGVVLGGVKALGPSLSKTSAAFAEVNPCGYKIKQL